MEQISGGRAFVSGTFVADVELIEHYEQRTIRVPLPGHGDGFKDVSTRGQAYVRFSSVETDFYALLERLTDSVGSSIEARRSMRDQGAHAVAVDLALEGGRNIIGASVTAPFAGYLTPETADFPIALPS